MHHAQCLRCEVRRSGDATAGMAGGRFCAERAMGRALAMSEAEVSSRLARPKTSCESARTARRQTDSVVH